MRLSRSLVYLLGNQDHALVDFIANAVSVGNGLLSNLLRLFRRRIRRVGRAHGLSSRSACILSRRLRGIGRRDGLLSRIERRIGRCDSLRGIIRCLSRRSDGISRVALSLFDAPIPRIDGDG